MAIRKRKLYPIGIQTFEEIREGNYFYADKTEYVYNMTHEDAKYMFLSRPRRFGKSLLISTLKCYFEGKKELFKGLAIDELETEWTEYPVLRFDMSLGKHLDKDRLEDYLSTMIGRIEKEYGITDHPTYVNDRLTNLIISAYKQTGKKVVVLIDEYDAPLLDMVHEDEQLPVLRNIMRNFYSPLKACAPYLRFVFLTGITKFSQLSIFSELNNIANISMLPRYAGICGITKDELLTQMSDSIDELAESQEMTRQQAIDALKNMYDGYHFTWPSPDIFNPFSLISAFANNDLGAYWFSSGTPTYLIEMMQKFNVVPSQLACEDVDASDFDAPTQTMTTLTPLLYQSGYITIKSCNQKFGLYNLDIPNKEVRVGLMRSLLPHYVSTSTQLAKTTAGRMAMALDKDDMEGALQLLKAFLSTVPYCDNTDYEGHWQQVLYIMFSLLGNFCDVEVHTANERVDLVTATQTRLYIVETKINKTAEAAMHQINLKDYAKRFALYTQPVVKVGINFDCGEHTLIDWKIEEA